MTVCSCWDIGRFCNCYCGAYDEWLIEKAGVEKRRHSIGMFAWAFVAGTFDGRKAGEELLDDVSDLGWA